MCGIAGYISQSAPSVHAFWPDYAVKSLHHRGPDDHGIYANTSKTACLIHTRLSILDLSPLGHQPISSADGRWQLVFNGELYNFRELRAELLGIGMRFRGHSDTEVLLALWQQYGPTCFPRLNGMFAMAIWDVHSRELLLVRDASGIKPLFWAETADGLIFASERKALVPLLNTPDQLDAEYLLQHLIWKSLFQTARTPLICKL